MSLVQDQFKMFGWDLIYSATERDLKKKEDVMTLLTHFVLIKNQFRCIGLGEDEGLAGSENSSELLPSGWNSSKNYTLRYVRSDEVYILRGVPIKGNVVFNLLNASTLAVTNTAFNVDASVAGLKGPLEKMVPTADDAVKKIQAELVDPLICPANKEGTTQTSATSSAHPSSAPCSLPEPSRPSPQGSPQVNPFWTEPERDPRQVGRQDLDPFGRGGGMIFNPVDPRGGIPDPGAGIPGGLPRGSVPPGARFDPFAPPAPDQRRPRRPPEPDN